MCTFLNIKIFYLLINLGGFVVRMRIRYKILRIKDIFIIKQGFQNFNRCEKHFLEFKNMILLILWNN